MPPTLCALLSGVDWRETGYQDVGLPDHQAKIDQAIADGFFSQPDHHVPGLFMSMGNLGSMNAGRSNYHLVYQSYILESHFLP